MGQIWICSGCGDFSIRTSPYTHSKPESCFSCKGIFRKLRSWRRRVEPSLYLYFTLKPAVCTVLGGVSLAYCSSNADQFPGEHRRHPHREMESTCSARVVAVARTLWTPFGLQWGRSRRERFAEPAHKRYETEDLYGGPDRTRICDLYRV